MAPIWLDLLDEAARMCTASGRPELTHRLQRQRAKLLDPSLRVVLIGEPRQGKSQLINALVNAPACPVGDDVTTSVCTVVHHAAEPGAVLVHTPEATGDGAAAAEPAERTVVPLTEFASRVSAGPPVGTEPGRVHAEVGLPRQLLAAGLVLVDTPGSEVPEGTHPGQPPAPPAEADVAVLVSDATRELSDTELTLLQRAARDYAAVLVVLTKIDIAPDWRRVAERNRQQLDRAGLPAPLLPVSATLRLQAAQVSDRRINQESGFPELIGRLLRYLRAKPDLLAPPAAGLLVGTVVRQLAAPLRAELSAAGASDAVTRLQEAQRALDELRRCATRWQNTLNDEVTDVLSDIEFDLRDRTRQILREAEEAFDTADPKHGWEEYSSWLDNALAEAAEANYEWLVERCHHVADRVAEQVEPYQADESPPWRQVLPDPPPGSVPRIEPPHYERFTLMQKAFVGLRGSYLGVLLFGLATTFLAGMPLLNPVSLGAGVLFAAKSIRDESKSYLKRRQAAAKSASQRHIDAALLTLLKEHRDLVRRVQRVLRDHYTARSEQAHDDIVASLRSAKQAADADAAAHNRRQREIRQRMRRLSGLYERARTLTTARAPLPAAAVAAGAQT